MKTTLYLNLIILRKKKIFLLISMFKLKLVSQTKFKRYKHLKFKVAKKRILWNYRGLLVLF